MSLDFSRLLLLIYQKIRNKRIRKYIQVLISTREGGYQYSKTLRQIYSKIHGIHIGYGTYGGCFDLDKIPKDVYFGNYSSIAKDVKIFRANHPSSTFTSHPLLYNPVMGVVKEDQLTRYPLVIGNDVWIGANVIILPGVRSIGNGAIIGAGSIVTKDVPPYNVIAGNPARVLKKRFKDSTIERLEKSKWWELEYSELAKKFEVLNAMVNESV